MSEPNTPRTERFWIEDHARDVARLLDEGLQNAAAPFGKRYGFALFFFEFSDDPNGLLTYISNGERADMIRMLEKWLERQKAGDAGTLVRPPRRDT